MDGGKSDAVNQTLDEWMNGDIKQDFDERVFNSACAETVHNGGPIDWQCWSELSNITPSQAARLANHIDPMTWTDANVYKRGNLPNELQEKINRLIQRLECRAQSWSLAALVDALGEDNAPFGMRRRPIRNTA